MKSWAFAGALLAVLCVSGVAEAGDPAVYKAPPPVSGAAAPGVFYAGVSLGGRWSDTDWMTTAIGSPPSPPNFGPAIPASFGSSTVRIGGYVGYMWRIAPTWVVGIEGDIAWGDGSKTIAGIPGTCCGGIASKIGTGASGVASDSCRRRLGCFTPPAASPGRNSGSTPAAAGRRLHFAVRPTANPCRRPKRAGRWAQVSKSCSGATGWSGLEYRFADYGHLDHTFFASPAGDRVVMNEALQTQTLLVGFAYKLGPPSQLVAQH